ncbi:MAG: InlB B-repeat-containing protein [Acholeplasmatales bacterium]|nr:InlB B-repeat-containing protein [Acholeplasmatales bacterium]
MKTNRLFSLFWRVIALIVLSIASIAFLGYKNKDVFADDVHSGYTEWTSTTSLPTSEGSYYLTSNVTISTSWTITSGTYNLDLNGYGIITTSGRVISMNGATLNLYDYGSTTHYFDVSDTGLANNVNDTSGTYSFSGGYITGGNGGSGFEQSAYYWGDGGAILVWSGTLNMYGGTVLGNKAGFGGGIEVVNGTMNMYGGTVMYNVSEQGAGINVRSQGYATAVRTGYFYMYGGSIEHNTGHGLSSAWCYGKASITVYNGNISNNTGYGISSAKLESDGHLLNLDASESSNEINIVNNLGGGVDATSIRLAGNVTIKDNTLSDSTCNLKIESGGLVYLNGALTAASPIGVTLNNNTGEFTSGFNTYMSDKKVSDYFSSDAGYKTVLLSTNEAALVVNITYDANGGTGSVVDSTNYYYSSDSQTYNATALSGDSLDFGFYVFNGWNTKSDGSGTAYAAGGEIIVSSDIVLYAQWTTSRTVIDKPETTATYTYNGLEQTFDLEENGAYTITNNTRTDAGTQTVIVSLNDKDSYGWSDGTTDDLEYTFTILKATGSIDTTDVVKEFTYDGTVKSISGATGTGTISYEDNSFTNAGEYTVTINSAASDNYLVATTTVDVVVHKATGSIDITGVVNEFTYDGTVKSISGATGTGTISYEDNSFTNAGQYIVTVNSAASDNYLAAATTVDVVVNKAAGSIDTTNVVNEFTYDGTAKSITGATGTGTISYEDNSFTNAGKYTVTINSAASDNYLAATATVNVVVNKAAGSIDITGVVNEFTYTGEALSITGATGTGTISYEDNSFTNVGEYTVKVNAAASDNYLATTDTVNVVVNKAKIEAPTANETIFVYDGSVKTYTLAISTLYTISDNITRTDAGSQIVTVTLNDTSNYTWEDGTIEALEYVFTVDRATIDMSNVSWDYTQAFIYDGEEKTVSLLNVPSLIEVTYTDNVKTLVGNYVAIATLTYDTDNYKEVVIPNLSWSIYKQEIDNTVVDEETGKPLVVISSDEGFDDNVSLEVKVKVQEAVMVEGESLNVDYSSLLGKNDKLSQVYDVILSLNGVPIQPSDLKEGTIITIKIKVPTELLDDSFKLVHAHSETDITLVSLGEEAAIGTYVIEDGYLVTRIDKLSEFAFIISEDEHGFCGGWLILIINIMLVVTACVYVILRIKPFKDKLKDKDERIALISCIVLLLNLVLDIVVIIIHQCAFGITAMILASILVIGAVFYYLYARKNRVLVQE